MIMYKLIALDIDGTLLNDRYEITERTRLAVRCAYEKGCRIVLCSARPVAAVKNLLIYYGLSDVVDYIVAGNGAWIYALTTETELVYQGLTRAELVELTEILERLEFDYHYFSRDSIYSTKPSYSSYTRFEAELFGLPLIAVDFGQLLKYELLKISVVGDKQRLDETLKTLPAEIYRNFQAVRTSDCYFEIMKRGTSKGKGLEYVARKEGIDSRRIIAIGDRENDISMIEFAGLGVAMGNADERLKRYADRVTLSNERDGVAEIIEACVINDL